jgi:hypothetical protein
MSIKFNDRELAEFETSLGTVMAVFEKIKHIQENEKERQNKEKVMVLFCRWLEELILLCGFIVGSATIFFERNFEIKENGMGATEKDSAYPVFLANLLQSFNEFCKKNGNLDGFSDITEECFLMILDKAGIKKTNSLFMFTNPKKGNKEFFVKSEEWQKYSNLKKPMREIQQEQRVLIDIKELKKRLRFQL